MSEGYVVSEGTNIYFRKMGHGPAIVMLHGNRQTHHIFAKIAQSLQENYQIILMDSRGHGRSSFGKQTLSLDIMVEDTFHLLEKLHLHQVILLGFSDGANLALHFAASYPTLVKGVLAVSPNVAPEGLKPWFLKTLKGSMVFLNILKKFHLPLERQAALTDLMLKHSQITDEELKRIVAPVLILTGEKDIIQKSHSQCIGATVAKGQVKVMGNAGHLTMFHKTDEYLMVMEEFLQSL